MVSEPVCVNRCTKSITNWRVCLPAFRRLLGRSVVTSANPCISLGSGMTQRQVVPSAHVRTAMSARDNGTTCSTAHGTPSSSASVQASCVDSAVNTHCCQGRAVNIPHSSRHVRCSAACVWSALESILRRNLPWASAVSVSAFASGLNESVICAIGEGALSAERHILVQVADVSQRSSRAIPSENGRSVVSALMSLVSSSSHSLSGNNMGSVLFQASGGRPCRGASRTCSSG